MNGINDFSLNQYLQRRLNIADSPAPASTLAPEIMPVLLAIPPSPEDLYLRGERLCAVTGVKAAVALEYSIATLSNPTGSNILLMLDRIVYNTGTNGVYFDHYLERTNLPSMGAVNGSVRDARWPLATGGARRHAAAFGCGSSATAPHINWGLLFQWKWIAGQPQTFNPEVVIPPGAMFIVYTNVVNSDLNIALFWRERPAQPSELV